MRRGESYDEKHVLTLLAEGSEYAFTQLFDHYRARIYSAAMRFLKSRELAEEVVQEVFLKVWVRRSELGSIQNFEAYLLTMARNKVFDSLKSIAKETVSKNEFALQVPRINATDPLVEKQYEQLLLEAVNQLPPQQKEIYRLARIEGLSHQAIAAELHISPLTVKTHMAKALQTIRHNLQHHLTSLALFGLILRAPDQF